MGDGDGATARIDSSLRSAPFRMTCWGAKGDGSPHTRGQRGGPAFRLGEGRAVRGGRGMGPRIREDNGWGVGSRFRLHGGRLSAGEGGWVHAYARTTGGRVDSRFRLHGGRFSAEGRGWVHAYARTTEGGRVPAPRLRGGQDLDARTTERDGRFANRPYGRRILSGTGFTPIPRLHEGRL